MNKGNSQDEWNMAAHIADIFSCADWTANISPLWVSRGDEILVNEELLMSIIQFYSPTFSRKKIRLVSNIKDLFQ